jgi:hypothetical protein
MTPYCRLHTVYDGDISRCQAWCLPGDPMTHLQADVGVDFCQVLVESYAVNERMNQIVLEHLDPAAWRAKLPGSKGRTIAANRGARPQRPAQMAEAVCPASNAPCLARPHQMHAEAGPGRSG